MPGHQNSVHSGRSNCDRACGFRQGELAGTSSPPEATWDCGVPPATTASLSPWPLLHGLVGLYTAILAERLLIPSCQNYLSIILSWAPMECRFLFFLPLSQETTSPNQWKWPKRPPCEGTKYWGGAGHPFLRSIS